jgi:hypothetical protein
VLFKSNTTGVTSRNETVYPSGAPDFIHITLWGACCSIVNFLCSVL